MHLGAGLSVCLTSGRWVEYLETYFKTFVIFLLLQFFLMPLVMQKFSSASQIYLGKHNIFLSYWLWNNIPNKEVFFFFFLFFNCTCSFCLFLYLDYLCCHLTFTWLIFKNLFMTIEINNIHQSDPTDAIWNFS